jgi:RNA polymerase sigma factor (TIGR02999 family)
MIRDHAEIATRPEPSVTPPRPTDTVTRILNRVETGDPAATAQWLPAVYDELRRLARSHLARERPGQTLQPTALVHDVYLRLMKDGGRTWTHRGHFFATAAAAMRRILIERARRRATAGRV